MHNFVGMTVYAAALAAVVSLCACVGGESAVQFEEKEYETPKLHASVWSVSFPGIADESFALSLEEGYKEEQIEFLSEAEERAAELAGQAQAVQKHRVGFESDKWCSIVTDTELDTGSVISRRSAKTIDLENKKEVNLEDLYLSEDAGSFLEQRLAEETATAEYSQLWKKPQIEQGQDFYLSKNALVLVYQPYELSYYEKGVVEIRLPYQKLRGYIKVPVEE